jgi:hypothetical protein
MDNLFVNCLFVTFASFAFESLPKGVRGLLLTPLALGTCAFAKAQAKGTSKRHKQKHKCKSKGSKREKGKGKREKLQKQKCKFETKTYVLYFQF